MKTSHRYLAALMAAGSITLALPLAAFANPAPGGEGCHGPMSMERGGHRPEFGMFGGHSPGYLRGLNLSEEQQDKIFNLMHAQAPAARAKIKELREARSNLEALVRSSAYDEARVRSLTDKAAVAMADLARMHARTEHQIYQLLTPEQRQALEERKDRRDDRGPGMRHGPGMGPGMRQG